MRGIREQKIGTPPVDAIDGDPAAAQSPFAEGKLGGIDVRVYDRGAGGQHFLAPGLQLDTAIRHTPSAHEVEHASGALQT
jgi:hypothetical protein